MAEKKSDVFPDAPPLGEIVAIALALVLKSNRVGQEVLSPIIKVDNTTAEVILHIVAETAARKALLAITETAPSLKARLAMSVLREKISRLTSQVWDESIKQLNEADDEDSDNS